MKRRKFILATGVAAAGIGIAGGKAFGNPSLPVKNNLPRWKGFNLLNYFNPMINGGGRTKTTEEDLKWMADWGFDFVRLPMAYPRFIQFDPSIDITPEDVYNIDDKEVDNVQKLIELANKYGLHVSLNLHRAPGFCVNAGFNEPYNLWRFTG